MVAVLDAVRHTGVAVGIALVERRTGSFVVVESHWKKLDNGCVTCGGKTY